ncbi:hypothetical protein AF384_24335, partial [Salmonella enterica subsp. enterica serovar Typhimurium]
KVYSVLIVVDVYAFKGQLVELLEARWALLRGVLNVGHLFKAPETLTRFYRHNDPSYSLNPGFCNTSKLIFWQVYTPDETH